MHSYELIIFLLFIVLIWYWQDGMHAKEIARHAGKQACDQDHVVFLDDTVVLERVRLRRNTRGNMVLYRSYQFEFTSDGRCRYTGTIQMLGKMVSSLSLEAHRIPAGL